MFKGTTVSKYGIDPFFFAMYFVSLNFNLRPNLEVKEYCEGQILVKCYSGLLSSALATLRQRRTHRRWCNVV